MINNLESTFQLPVKIKKGWSWTRKKFTVLCLVLRTGDKVYKGAHIHPSEVETVELNGKYPMLADHISASEIITPQQNELLIYNTTTGAKTYPNKATFDFLALATGTKSTEQIVEELSISSKEPPEKIWPGLTHLITRMIQEGMLVFSDSPSQNPRNPPPSVRLVHRLENISFETTRKCNLRCKHCYSDSGAPLQDELTVREIKALIDQLSDIGILSITFTGGESLLHPYLFELIEYARKKPLTVLLFTNGTLLTSRIVRKLKECNVYQVNVSIDGPDPQTHDTFRGLQGAFEKTIQGVNLLKAAGIPVHASISITKANYKKLKEILSLIKDMGFHQYKLWPVSFSGRSKPEEFFTTTEEFRKAMESVREFEFEEMGKKEKEEFFYSKNLKNCGIGTNALAIKCNGVVTACPAFDDSASLGNVRNQSVADIWNNSVLLNELRAMSVFETEICRDCEFAAMCKGGCIADIYERSKKFTCYDEYMCVAFDVTKNDYIPVEVEDMPSTSLSVEVV